MRNVKKGLLTVIMLNPSYANKNVSDKTVNIVIKHGWYNNYGEIQILNISPFYETLSDKVVGVMTADGDFLRKNQKNLDYIIEAIKNNRSHILLAIGKVKGHIMNELYHLVLDKLQSHFMVFDITKDRYAWHPRNVRNTIIEGEPRIAKIGKTKIVFE